MDEQKIAEALAELIFLECKGYFDTCKHTLYRGIKVDAESLPRYLKSSVSKNRIPLHCSNELTNQLNILYAQVGSPVTRNNCIFTSPHEGLARDYGNLFIVFPVGAYSALWNNAVDDPYLTFEKCKELEVDRIGQPFYMDLATDPLGNVEVMITCDSFYAVENDFYHRSLKSALGRLLES